MAKKRTGLAAENHRKQALRYYRKNRKACIKRVKAYSARNAEKIAAKHKEYAAQHKDQIAAYKKRWRSENLDAIKEKSRKNRNANRASISSEKRLDRVNNPAKYAALARSDRGKWYEYRGGAKKRKLPWELSFEMFSSLLHAPCAYCDTSGVEASRGVDRIDSDRGYVLDNVMPCCSKCNWMKRALSFEEFASHVLKIAESLRKHNALTGSALY